MSSEAYRDRAIDEVTDKVMQHPSIDVDEDVVRDKATNAVDELLDAPLQTFTTVLAENTVMSDLYRERADEDGRG